MDARVSHDFLGIYSRLEPHFDSLYMHPAEEADYSILSACVGSILQARSAGTALAINAVSKRLAIIAIKTAGSSGCVPNKMDLINIPAAAPPASPIMRPM